MNKTIKNALLFAAAMIPISAIGGIFTVIYAFSTYEQNVQQLILESSGSYEMLVIAGAIQAIIITVACGFIGYIISEKIGLMRRFHFTKVPLIRTAIITVVCGILFGLDYWVFGGIIPQLKEMNSAMTDLTSFLSSFFYGGIVEEVLLRLFLMSLFALILWKIFFRKYKKEQIPQIVFIIANIIAALLFSAGHLPTTINTFGSLTPILVFRCFLINGGLGIAFGYLYRKYGIQYAMFAHAGCHMVSKIMWLLFI